VPDYRDSLNNALTFLASARVEIVLFLAVVLGGTALYLILTPIPGIPRWIWKSFLPLILGTACFVCYMRVCDPQDVVHTFRGDPQDRLIMIGATISGAAVSTWVLLIAWIRKRTAGTGDTQIFQKPSG